VYLLFFILSTFFLVYHFFHFRWTIFFGAGQKKVTKALEEGDKKETSRATIPHNWVRKALLKYAMAKLQSSSSNIPFAGERATRRRAGSKNQS